MKTIKVTQGVSEKLPPDTAVVEIRLAGESKKYADAVQAVKTQWENALRLLEQAGLSAHELRESGTAVDTRRRDSKVLYRAHKEVKAVLQSGDARLGSVIEKLEESGLEWSQSYTLTKGDYRAALLEKAVQEARKAAETIAAAAGVKIGALAAVEYQAYGNPPRLMRAMAANADMAAPEEIEASETVTCEWEIA